MLSCLGVPERYLRLTVGTAVSVVASAGGGLAAWPELLAALVQALDGGSLDAQEGALDAVFKARLARIRITSLTLCCQICEEIPDQLDKDVPGMLRPAALLLPRLLSFFSRWVQMGSHPLVPGRSPRRSPHVQLQKLAVGSVNMLVGFMPAALVPELDRYVQARRRGSARACPLY